MTLWTRLLPAGVFGFESIEFEESAVGIEDGEWECFGEFFGFEGIELRAGGAVASKDRESSLASDDFAAGDAFGCVGPG